MIYAGFLSLFSLDAFGPGFWWEQIIGFLIHNLPAFLIVALLVVVWKKPSWGAFAFYFLTLVFTYFFHLYENWLSFLVIGLPLLIVAILFTVENFLQRKKNSV